MAKRGPKHGRAPSDAGRNAIRVQITLLPAELAELDAFTARLARPGYAANRSEALRLAVQAVLNAEEDALVELSPGSIRWKGNRG